MREEGGAGEREGERKGMNTERETDQEKTTKQKNKFKGEFALISQTKTVEITDPNLSSFEQLNH